MASALSRALMTRQFGCGMLRRVLSSQGHSKGTALVTSVAFSPDGKRVVSGSRDKTIRVWDAETGAVVSGPFEGHSSAVISVAFSPDGKRIVSGSDDKTIRVWDAETGDVVSGPFEGHRTYVSSVAFSPGWQTHCLGLW
jgi:WD40 repeat protein